MGFLMNGELHTTTVSEGFRDRLGGWVGVYLGRVSNRECKGLRYDGERTWQHWGEESSLMLVSEVNVTSEERLRFGEICFNSRRTGEDS